MLDMDLTNRDTFASLFLDLVNITVKDLSLNLNMSTVTGLADLIEDEVIPVPFPVKVNIVVSLLIFTEQLRLPGVGIVYYIYFFLALNYVSTFFSNHLPSRNFHINIKSDTQKIFQRPWKKYVCLNDLKYFISTLLFFYIS